MQTKRYLSSTLSAALLIAAGMTYVPAAQAGLMMEPVFNRVPGSGPGGTSFPLYQPNLLAPDGIAYLDADEPGEIATYPSGDPRDPDLDVFFVWNNTSYNITGFILRIVGSATDTRHPGTIVRGPVDAVWGDVNGDGDIGVSDIFATVVVSPDGKEIRFENGLIPVGGRFTDIHLAVSDSPPSFAGVDATFTGQLVPEPYTFVLTACGLTPILFRAPRRNRRCSR
ncbi:MAG: hypothetical protein ACRD7E_11060 [Bryobacteraceae bacterium]